MATFKFFSDEDLEKAVSAVVAAYDTQYQPYAKQQQQQQQHAHRSADVAPLVPPPRVLVALAGRPGSGKTTVASSIAAKLQERLQQLYSGAPTEVCIMPMDGYHYYKKELQQMKSPRRAFERRGAEWTFNTRKLRRDLVLIRTARPPPAAAAAAPAAAAVARTPPHYTDVWVPSFDHGRGDPVERHIRIPASAGVVLVEGNYLLLNHKGKKEDWAAVYRCFHVRLFLYSDPAVCLAHLIQRHMRAWGVPYAEAEKRAKGSDTKNGDLVDTTKKNADVVLRSLPVAALRGSTAVGPEKKASAASPPSKL